MSEYRTTEQFLDICDSMINGNWTQAGQDCAKWGFYANDLRTEYEQNAEVCGITDIFDFCELLEIANRYR